MLPAGVLANQIMHISPMHGEKLVERGLHWLGFGESLKFHQLLKLATHQAVKIPRRNTL
jgi:hypothetical protein